MNQKYPKKEKLKKKRELDLLFGKGKWFTCGNLRIVSFHLNETTQENLTIHNQKIGVSVSKRYFKKSVDRNRIKRLLRESYRLNKEVFAKKFGSDSLSMLFWISAEKPKHYSEVEKEFLMLCESKK